MPLAAHSQVEPPLRNRLDARKWLFMYKIARFCDVLEIACLWNGVLGRDSTLLFRDQKRFGFASLLNR